MCVLMSYSVNVKWYFWKILVVRNWYTMATLECDFLKKEKTYNEDKTKFLDTYCTGDGTQIHYIQHLINAADLSKLDHKRELGQKWYSEQLISNLILLEDTKWWKKKIWGKNMLLNMFKTYSHSYIQCKYNIDKGAFMTAT